MEVTKIELRELKIHPLSTDSEHLEHGNMVTFKAELQNEEFEYFRHLIKNHWEPGKYFQANFFNQSNSFLKEVRFGRVIFSKGRDKVKVRATLVQKELDENNQPNPDFDEPVGRNIEKMLLKVNNSFDNLCNILLSKGVLDDGEVGDIKEFSREQLIDEKLDLFKVDDLDDFLKKNPQ
ncbi:hypothetical protein ACQCVK_04180 [Rossellomorea vietnamensis]|uniref:hypothetical protein n=1 Tax=Rossellomorea vietnamensis TaxID=218284 RepID=UPI003CEFE57C